MPGGGILHEKQKIAEPRLATLRKSAVGRFGAASPSHAFHCISA
jgi:hypothetical protein